MPDHFFRKCCDRVAEVSNSREKAVLLGAIVQLLASSGAVTQGSGSCSRWICPSLTQWLTPVCRCVRIHGDCCSGSGHSGCGSLCDECLWAVCGELSLDGALLSGCFQWVEALYEQKSHSKRCLLINGMFGEEYLTIVQ